MIAGSEPLIDVWPILQGAARGVVEGRNPYEMTFAGVPPGQVDDCFNYLPGTFLVPLPGRLLAGDVRYAEAAVLLAGVAALVWYAVRRRPRTATALAVLAGVLPGSLYDVQQAWNETIVFGSLAAAGVLVAVRKPWWAAAALAVALCTKQHVVLLLPLWALWPAFGPRRAVAAAAGAAARSCCPGSWPTRAASGTAWSTSSSTCRPGTTRCRSGSWSPARCARSPCCALVAVAYVLAVRGLPRTPGGLLLGSGLVLAAFALANKQSFLNQWLLAAQLVVAGLSLVAASTRPTRTVPLPSAETVPGSRGGD